MLMVKFLEFSIWLKGRRVRVQSLRVQGSGFRIAGQRLRFQIGFSGIEYDPLPFSESFASRANKGEGGILVISMNMIVEHWGVNWST